MICCPMCRTFFIDSYEEGDICPNCGQDNLIDYLDYLDLIRFMRDHEESENGSESSG